MAQTNRYLRAANLAAAIVLSTAILYVAFFGAGPLPALGPAFNPSTGAWSVAFDASIGKETQHLSGLQQTVHVTLDRDGTAHIVAQTDHDLFLAVGYMHARFRLFQMDLLRRQGEGRLSEVVGKAALDSDRFELQLGLLRTAEREWNSDAATRPGRSDCSRIYGLGPTAASLAAIMGFVHQPAIPVILTCALGLLLGLAGAWLGSSGRALIQPAISR